VAGIEMSQFYIKISAHLASDVQCRIELERTRLLVLEAADQLDRHGNKKARGILAMAKVIVLFVTQHNVLLHGSYYFT